MAHYYHSHIQTAVKILEAYKGELPFATFLKTFFSKEKKYGSKDRKQIAAFCYYYFRTGKSLKAISKSDKILAGIFLCENLSNPVLASLKPEWNMRIADKLSEKLQLLSVMADQLFPFVNELSEGLDAPAFSLSFLQQPKLFIRIRPRKTTNVFQKLDAVNVAYEKINEQCLAFDQRTKVDSILKLNEEYVVQDYNSQRVGEFIAMAERNEGDSPTIKVWDCCAASGGKSILAYDTLPDLHLTVSDIRKTIIHNLQTRFREAGIKNFQSFITDLSQSQGIIPNAPFDLIICDAPCSGSGTWGRTPEQLSFFKEEEIEKYSALQKKIGLNALKQLKPGGYFLYITCSVFAKENEQIVEFILQNSQLKLMRSELLKGYKMQADTMFAALFVKE